MNPYQHVTLSASAGVIVGFLLRSWVAGAACCFVGVFVDLDHVLDFWLDRGINFSPRQFLDFCYYGTSRRFLVVLHGYEYIPMLLWMSMGSGYSKLGWGMTVGYVLHLVADRFFNTEFNRWTYFLSYRIFHRFDASKIVKHPPPPRPNRD